MGPRKKIRQHLQRPAEHTMRCLEPLVLVDRLRHMPAHPRPAALQVGKLAQQGRRTHRAGQQAKPLSLGAINLAGAPEGVGIEGGPCRGLPQMQRHLRTLGIVKPQQGCLHEEVGRTTRRGMAIVSLELDRAAGDTLAHHRLQVACKAHGRGVPLGLARYGVVRRTDVGKSPLVGLGPPSVRGRQCERGGHRLQQRTAIERGRPVLFAIHPLTCDKCCSW